MKSSFPIFNPRLCWRLVLFCAMKVWLQCRYNKRVILNLENYSLQYAIRNLRNILISFLKLRSLPEIHPRCWKWHAWTPSIMRALFTPATFVANRDRLLKKGKKEAAAAAAFQWVALRMARPSHPKWTKRPPATFCLLSTDLSLSFRLGEQTYCFINFMSDILHLNSILNAPKHQSLQ